MLSEQSFYIKIAVYGRIVPKNLIQHSLKVDINSVIHVLRYDIISGSNLPQFYIATGSLQYKYFQKQQMLKEHRKKLRAKVESSSIKSYTKYINMTKSY